MANKYLNSEIHDILTMANATDFINEKIENIFKNCNIILFVDKNSFIKNKSKILNLKNTSKNNISIKIIQKKINSENIKLIENSIDESVSFLIGFGDNDICLMTKYFSNKKSICFALIPTMSCDINLLSTNLNYTIFENTEFQSQNLPMIVAFDFDILDYEFYSESICNMLNSYFDLLDYKLSNLCYELSYVNTFVIDEFFEKIYTFSLKPNLNYLCYKINFFDLYIKFLKLTNQHCNIFYHTPCLKKYIGSDNTIYINMLLQCICANYQIFIKNFSQNVVNKVDGLTLRQNLLSRNFSYSQINAMLSSYNSDYNNDKIIFVINNFEKTIKAELFSANRYLTQSIKMLKKSNPQKCFELAKSCSNSSLSLAIYEYADLVRDNSILKLMKNYGIIC